MNTEPLSIKEGLAGRVGQRSENSLQIGTSSDSAEHLRETEGLHALGR